MKIMNRRKSNDKPQETKTATTTTTVRRREIGEKKMTMFSLRDWRQSLRTPHVYRVGNSNSRLQLVGITLILAIILLFAYPTLRECPSSDRQVAAARDYDSTYPLTPPIQATAGVSYRIGIISDFDKENKDGKVWFSLLKRGHILWNHRGNSVSVVWDETPHVRLTSSLSLGGRAMELSELVTFNGHLLAFDDRTGVVYKLEGNSTYPWLLLMDGNGKSTKGFKSEWATVKGQQLYVGSMGKEWTTDTGVFEHNNPMWVKVISPSGEIQSLDWMDNFKKLRKSIDIEFPGYMIHESGVWSEIHKSWFFLPRRCSKARYNDITDEIMSCNVLLTADEDFTTVKVTNLDNHVEIRGYSSFKFLPGSQDTIIVALKTEEFKGKTATYITAFTIDGDVLLPDERIVDHKFEGLEFI